MPTPLDILLDPISLTAMGIYLSLMLWEAVFPARSLPRARFWVARGLTAFVVYFLLSSYLPLWWDSYLVTWQLFDLTAYSTLLQFALGLGCYELLAYWWHRSLHQSDFLWRGFHQMHHSAERLDTFGAFWLSPPDMAGFTLIASLALVLVLGINPQAATGVLLATFFLAVFQHTNVKTPRWLGYLVQRPESHSLHHGRGVHKNNYSDLPVFDMLFGTFINPSQFRHTGFYQGASNRVLEMLCFRDVSEPPKTSPDKIIMEAL